MSAFPWFFFPVGGVVTYSDTFPSLVEQLDPADWTTPIVRLRVHGKTSNALKPLYGRLYNVTTAAGVAGSVNGRPASSGTYVPDVIYCNVGRRHAGENTYHEMNILADIAGGLPANLHLEGDYNNEKTGALLSKYIMRNPKIPAEYQQRCFRMVGDYLCSSWGSGWAVAAVHGGGSPIMETIAILGNYDLNATKKIARHLAGIPEEPRGPGA